MWPESERFKAFAADFALAFSSGVHLMWMVAVDALPLRGGRPGAGFMGYSLEFMRFSITITILYSIVLKTFLLSFN